MKETTNFNSQLKIKDYCETVEKEFNTLVDQLSKIIAIKKKSYDAAAGDVMQIKALDISRDIENLEKIRNELLTASKIVNDLRRQVELLLLVKPLVKESKV